MYISSILHHYFNYLNWFWLFYNCNSLINLYCLKHFIRRLIKYFYNNLPVMNINNYFLIILLLCYSNSTHSISHIYIFYNFSVFGATVRPKNPLNRLVSLYATNGFVYWNCHICSGDYIGSCHWFIENIFDFIDR